MTELMTVPRAAKLLAITKKRVYQLIASGRLEALRTSPRGIRVTCSSVEDFIRKQVERERRELGLDIAPVLKRRH
jgi:excisionase family DNA binding protein